MAYLNGDVLVVVKGNFPSGEVWANTWAFHSVADDGEVQDLVDALRTFYNNYFGMVNDEVEATTAEARNLFTGLPVTVTWLPVGGDETAFSLPPECALRVSIRNVFGDNGGPFMPATAVSVINEDGSLISAQDGPIESWLETLRDDIAGIGAAQLGLHSPANEVVNSVSRVRVGHIFDVIRARRNQLNEAYISVTGWT